MNHHKPSLGKDTMTRTLITMALTLAPLVVSAAGWTTGWAKVLSVLTNNVAGANYVWVETTANNVNNGTTYDKTGLVLKVTAKAASVFARTYGAGCSVGRYRLGHT